MPAPALALYHVRIPMRFSFGHARAKRSQADNVFARVTLADGQVGWGEAVPREYVTGESVASVLEQLAAVDLLAIAPPAGASFEDAARHLYAVDLPSRLASGGKLGNASACALETALLDAHARREGRHVASAIAAVPELAALARPEPPAEVRQSLTVGDDLEAALERAGSPSGPIEVKVKVGFDDDRARVAKVRARVGEGSDLRLDANGVWSLDQAVARLGELAELRPSSVEEPLAPRALAACAALRARAGVPLMLDESLCTLADARAAADAGAADLFNLRLSKCGGLLGTLRIAAFARSCGIGYQLGCMVGETGLLASLGRAFAARVQGVRHLEASVPEKLLEADVTDASIAIDLATRTSRVPSGPGFGANVLEAAIARYRVA